MPASSHRGSAVIQTRAKTTALLFLAPAGMGARPVLAAPAIPADDGLVLQRVLPNADPRLQAIREKTAALAQHPGDPDLSLDLASRQLSVGVAEADPRFVGYAQGTLAQW